MSRRSLSWSGPTGTSQRVLERNGFTRFGVAPRYLNIAGQWQDHALYQLIADLGR